jgi:hypothetical protein
VRRPGNPFREDQYVKGVEDLLKFEDAMGQIGKAASFGGAHLQCVVAVAQGAQWHSTTAGRPSLQGAPIPPSCGVVECLEARRQARSGAAVCEGRVTLPEAWA